MLGSGFGIHDNNIVFPEVKVFKKLPRQCPHRAGTAFSIIMDLANSHELQIAFFLHKFRRQVGEIPSFIEKSGLLLHFLPGGFPVSCKPPELCFFRSFLLFFLKTLLSSEIFHEVPWSFQSKLAVQPVIGLVNIKHKHIFLFCHLLCQESRNSALSASSFSAYCYSHTVHLP
ncbi:hypothetical protein DSECCO2_426630 [anaerobic digester metagenome]